MSKQVLVERYIKQVAHGLSYEGTLKVENTSFEFEILFFLPIAWIDPEEIFKKKEGRRYVFQITLKKDGKEIELSEDEYDFFFELLVYFAIFFYHLPETQRLNQGLVPTLVYKGMIDISITSEGDYRLKSEVSKMLKKPKFNLF